MRQLIEWILDASFHYDLWFHHYDFKFDIVCCHALLQVKANLCKCNNLGGYFLHRYKKPRARTNEVSSTERKNSICLARGFDINFCCKHYVLYNMHLICLDEGQHCFVKNVHADWVLLNLIYLFMTRNPYGFLLWLNVNLFIMISS